MTTVITMTKIIARNADEMGSGHSGHSGHSKKIKVYLGEKKSLPHPLTFGAYPPPPPIEPPSA